MKHAHVQFIFILYPKTYKLHIMYFQVSEGSKND